MKRSNLWTTICFLLCMAAPPLAQASDTAKEKRWADQIVDELIDGDAVWLRAGDHRFLAIHMEHNTEALKGGAIILHGIGIHPNWQDVIYPLRTGLPERGWTTLSLQMPILPNEAEPDEYAPLMVEVPPRIDAAVAFLKQQGIDNIVLIGHSLGAVMAIYYLAGDSASVQEISAVAAIGLNARDTVNENLDTLLMLERVKLPLLDLMGSEDNAFVKDTANERQEAAKRGGNARYAQRVIQGANHFHVGQEAAVLETVDTWLVNSTGAGGG